MKVCLVWAKGQLGLNVSPPLGVCYIAAYIRKELPIKPDIIDANLERLSVNEVLERIIENKYEVVGISFMTPQADFAFELSKMIKETDDEICIVHGGSHPTVRPADSIENHADFCVIGEGEVTFKELLESIMKGEKPDNVDGLVFKVKKKIHFTNPRQFIQNLDEIPYPAFDLVPFERYRENIHIREGKAMPMMGSRGCPFDCSFCASPVIWHRKVRYRGSENILDEIQDIMEKYNITRFHFYDDNFLLSVDRMEEFCQAIEKKDLEIEWICLARADIINRRPDILMTMKNAGCVGIEIGIETLDDKALISTNKKISASDSLEALQNILDSGLEIACLQLMTFNVGETISGHYFQNKKLNEITGKKGAFFGQFATPYPGTRFGEEAEKNGIVLVDKWRDYVTSNVNFVPRTLLNEKPVRNLKRLRLTDSMTISGELSFIDKRHILDISNIIDNQRKIRFVFSKCSGENSVEEICGYCGKRFDMEYRDAMAYTLKVVVIMSQLGLIKPKNSEHFQYEILPDWQKRFYGIDTNLEMNIYILVNFLKLSARLLSKRFNNPGRA